MKLFRIENELEKYFCFRAAFNFRDIPLKNFGNFVLGISREFKTARNKKIFFEFIFDSKSIENLSENFNF